MLRYSPVGRAWESVGHHRDAPYPRPSFLSGVPKISKRGLDGADSSSLSLFTRPCAACPDRGGHTPKAATIGPHQQGLGVEVGGRSHGDGSELARPRVVRAMPRAVAAASLLDRFRDTGDADMPLCLIGEVV
jgi:hypothetical protein